MTIIYVSPVWYIDRKKSRKTEWLPACQEASIPIHLTLDKDQKIGANVYVGWDPGIPFTNMGIFII